MATSYSWNANINLVANAVRSGDRSVDTNQANLIHEYAIAESTTRMIYKQISVTYGGTTLDLLSITDGLNQSIVLESLYAIAAKNQAGDTVHIYGDIFPIEYYTLDENRFLYQEWTVLPVSAPSDHEITIKTNVALNSATLDLWLLGSET